MRRMRSARAQRAAKSPAEPVKKSPRLIVVARGLGQEDRSNSHVYSEGVKREIKGCPR